MSLPIPSPAFIRNAVRQFRLRFDGEFFPDAATIRRRWPETWREYNIAYAIRCDRPDQVARLLKGGDYGLAALTDMDRLHNLDSIALTRGNSAAQRIFTRHIATTHNMRAPFQEIAFRRLNPDDANNVVAIEQAITRKDPDSMRLGHIHAKTPEDYAALLDANSGSTFIGAFVNVNGQQKLVGYGASLVRPPSNILDLHAYDEQLVGLIPPRHIALPVSAHSGSGIFYLIRVDPECQTRGVGTEVVVQLIQNSLGLIGTKQADFMIADITVTNLASLRSHFKAGELAGTTSLVWAAGRDGGANNVPSLTVLQTLQVAPTAMPALHAASAELIFGKHYDDFAAVLDSGYVAWISFEGRDSANWRVHIAERPDNIGIRRAIGETPAPTMTPDDMIARLGGATNDHRAPNILARALTRAAAELVGRADPTPADYAVFNHVLSLADEDFSLDGRTGKIALSEPKTRQAQHG